MTKSFANTLISQIPQANQEQLAYLGQLIQSTDILNRHEAIIQAWKQRLNKLKLSGDKNFKKVETYLLSQKKKNGRNSKGMDGDLDDLKEITRRLDSLLKSRETRLTSWQITLAENMFDMQRLIANIVG